MIGIGMPRSFYRDMFDFRREFEEMFGRMAGEWPRISEPKMLGTFIPEAEAWTDTEQKKYYLRVALPGIDPKEAKVEVQGKVLTIMGERKTTETKKEVNFTHREFTYGSFERIVNLPEGVEAEKLTAEFKNGVLEISAPFVVAAVPHRVEIKKAA